MTLLTVVLNDKVKDFICKSAPGDIITHSPFFHFDILDENNESIYTSHDFGDDVLMFLTASDFEEITKQHIMKSELISLPETIEVMNEEREL